MGEAIGSGYFNEPLPPNSGNAVSFTISASTSATEVKSGSNRLDKRRGIYLQNQSDTVVKWGFSSSTCYNKLAADTDADGNGGHIWLDIGDNQAVYLQAESGSGKTVACNEVK